MKLKITAITPLLFILLLCGLVNNSSATHTSAPVLVEPKTEYFVGEKIKLNGWVNYNDQPTADVLLSFRVFSQGGAMISKQSYPSDHKGYFNFEFDTTNHPAGSYRVTITSHCLEIHRSVCSYRNDTVIILVHER